MPPFRKRKRQLSASSFMSRTSQPPSSQLSTPLASFKRPFLASPFQAQSKRVVCTSQPALQRALSTSEVSRSRDDQQSLAISEYDNDEVLDNVIMAIDMKERGTVGCAYYIAREERLFCMEDVIYGGKDVVETCNYHNLLLGLLLTNSVKLELQPSVVLASLRVKLEGDEFGGPRDSRQASLVDEGKETHSRIRGSNSSLADDRLPLPYRLDYQPNVEFSYEGAKNKLVNLQ